MTREEAHKLVDQLFDQKDASVANGPSVEFTPPTKVLPQGKKVVRTKTSGDKVYLLDETKTPATRQWIVTGDVLTGLGFEQSDVSEISDVELFKYSMGPAFYRVPDAA